MLLLVLTVLTAGALAGRGCGTQHNADEQLSRLQGFFRQRVLPDGERERRLHWKRLSLIETSVKFPDDLTETNTVNSSWSQEGLVLRQATDGKHYIQLIYEGGQLRDCEYVRDKASVRQFLSRLKEDMSCVAHLLPGVNRTCPESGPESNGTLDLIRRRSDLPKDLAKLLDYRELRRHCRDLHRRIRHALDHRTDSKESRVLAKRSLLYPGTKWCGSGTSASSFKELGYHAAADRCCRDHDFCPFTIEAWQTKYNYPNIRPYTVSHCDCDERLRACLKLAETAAANMVGRLFFNVIQTKCFKFRSVHKCVQRSWWGKCLKKQKQKEAFLKDALTF